MKHNPANNPVWGEIANAMKLMLRSVNGEIGVMLIANKGGAVVAILEGGESMKDQELLSQTLREFQQRLGEMTEHQDSGKLDWNKNKQVFIRDDDTGEYHETDSPSFN